MLIVIDAGNTRTKWAQVQEDGKLSAMQAASNKSLDASDLKPALATADEVVIANVAGETVAEQLVGMMPDQLTPIFVMPQAEACGVINQYEEVETLGVDRWAAVIATWELNKQPSIVINAGTAITIDALGKDKTSKKGTYLGGSIMPGLQLMYGALSDKAANLAHPLSGKVSYFPKNTDEAIYTGCMNAVVGAVVLQMKQLEKHCAFLPKVVISGGDAVKIADALSPHIRRVIVKEDLVLQGLSLLGKS